ncbi:MAG: histidine phosphatase family protein [Clostridia bacterium]|jgi:broad specificity phosphatase PhoE|nr:histidine phosphatase family protein [Clostridia bacterium]
MTKLILVRHGQSIANAENKFAGHSDFDLSPLGKTQAELTGEYIVKREKIDKIYASDLLRAYNTVVPASKKTGIPIIPTTSLREIFAGEWEALTVGAIAENYPIDFDKWKNDFSNSRPTGGESVEELYYRIRDAICAIAEENPNCTVLIGTHATPVRAFECFARGLGADMIHTVPFCHNTAINIFEYKEGRAYPIETNITEHLSDLITALPKEINA